MATITTSSLRAASDELHTRIVQYVDNCTCDELHAGWNCGIVLDFECNGVFFECWLDLNLHAECHTFIQEEYRQEWVNFEVEDYKVFTALALQPSDIEWQELKADEKAILNGK